MMETEINTWPLWMCLKPEQFALLIMYQWKRYGLKLDLMSSPPSNIHIDTQVESLDEISQIMRWKPRYLKGVEIDY